MQKSVQLGVSVGESFAEYTLLSNSEPIAQKRVYLAREGLKQSLSQFISVNLENKPHQAFVSLRLPKKLLDFELSGAVAHIATEGFEHWLNLSNKGARPLTDANLLFSIQERVRADGTIETPINLEQLESIAEKIKMMDSKKVCLHFLHSPINPENLKKAQAFLLEKGLEVFTPENSDSADEVKRWNKNALSATISGIYSESKAEIHEALQGTLTKDQIYFISSSGKLTSENKSEDPSQEINNLFSAYTAIGTVFGGSEKSDILYLGLENFLLISGSEWVQTWSSPWGDVEVPHLKTVEIGIQPTSGITLNGFGRFDFSTTQEGWEPGPMFMGRGQKLSLLDLWAENSKLARVPGLEDRLSPQGIQRFKNAFYTLSKLSKAENNEVSQLSKGLQSLAMQRLAIEAVLHRQRKKMIVTGPLASVFANVFKKDPYSVINNQEFSESYATAIWGAQVLRETL